MASTLPDWNCPATSAVDQFAAVSRSVVPAAPVHVAGTFSRGGAASELIRPVPESCGIFVAPSTPSAPV